MFFQLYADIISNKKIAGKEITGGENARGKNAGGIYKMLFFAPAISKTAMPGQFVHVRCSDSYKPLLRRPFSIQQANKTGEVGIIYKVVGEGTSNLTKLKDKDKIDILGPLGNHFLIPEFPKKIFIVAGGVGIVTFSFLIDFILEKKVKVLDNIEVVFGTHSSENLILKDKLKQEEINLHFATEDGSLGRKCTVVELFEKLIRSHNNDNCLVYAGGPTGMLKELCLVCKRKNIPAQVAYENVMGCGVGSCLGCVIETKFGLKRVCKDGPIFDATHIKW